MNDIKTLKEVHMSKETPWSIMENASYEPAKRTLAIERLRRALVDLGLEPDRFALPNTPDLHRANTVIPVNGLSCDFQFGDDVWLSVSLSHRFPEDDSDRHSTSIQISRTEAHGILYRPPLRKEAYELACRSVMMILLGMHVSQLPAWSTETATMSTD